VTDQTDDDDDVQRTPIERLEDHQLSESKAREVANATKASGAGPYASHVVPVRDTGDEIVVGSATTIHGGERIEWSDSVLFTFGAGGKSVREVRHNYRIAKSRVVDGSR
jgi:hypothetical protein